MCGSYTLHWDTLPLLWMLKLFPCKFRVCTVARHSLQLRMAFISRQCRCCTRYGCCSLALPSNHHIHKLGEGNVAMEVCWLLTFILWWLLGSLGDSVSTTRANSAQGVDHLFVVGKEFTLVWEVSIVLPGWSLWVVPLLLHVHVSVNILLCTIYPSLLCGADSWPFSTTWCFLLLLYCRDDNSEDIFVHQVSWMDLFMPCAVQLVYSFVPVVCTPMQSMFSLHCDLIL